MLNRGIRKYITNPALGLFPFIVFASLHAIFRDVEYEGLSLVIALVIAIMGEIILRSIYKSRAFSLIFFISWFSFLIALIVWFFTKDIIHKPRAYIIISEVIIVCVLIFLRGVRPYIAAKYFRNKTPFQKTMLSEFYDSAKLIQYAFTFHLFGILLYRVFIDAPYTQTRDIVVFSVIPISLILIVGIYQIFKVNRLVSRLEKEEWIPIVNERGEVTGKIAKSVSLNMKNRFLHPVVRVALISNSKVYLQERPANDVLSPGKLDYPFEKYMLFKHEINLAARNSIIRMIGEEKDFNLKFVLKYVFENDNTKRLNFLFVVNVDSEEEIKREGKMSGKFWSIKQIEDSFADEIFSECFELEFEYLKNMVLLPTDVMGKAN